MERHPENEFSRPFAVADLDDEGAELEIAADADERAALARRFGLVSLDALSATVSLAHAGGDGAVRLSASFVADVVQTCVVSLDPVAARIDETIELTYSPAQAAGAPVEVVVDAEDEPEPLIGDTIDLGEAVAEHLGLNLDPYPRRPGVVFSAETAWTGDESEESPFEVLRRLKREPKS